MTSRSTARAGADLAAWVIHLPCGHVVGFPSGAQMPSVSVEILDHQDRCTAETHDPSFPPWRYTPDPEGDQTSGIAGILGMVPPPNPVVRPSPSG